MRIRILLSVFLLTAMFFACKKSSDNSTTPTTPTTPTVTYSRADYLWSKSPAAYSYNDSDITSHTHVYSSNNGGNITAGSGANDIVIGNFIGYNGALYATVNGASLALNPASQAFYPYTYSGSGSINSGKNVITLNLHESSQNHDHLIVLTKL